MFGFTQEQMDTYQELVQQVAADDISTAVLSSCRLMAPPENPDSDKPDMDFVIDFKADLQAIITLCFVNVSYKYCHLKSEGVNDQEILKKLHKEYVDKVHHTLLTYCIVPTVGAVEVIVENLVMQIPFLYCMAFEIVEDEVLKDLEAYDKYLDDAGYEYDPWELNTNSDALYEEDDDDQ